MPAPEGLPDPQLMDDHKLACRVVREAGALALSFYEGDYKQWDKGENNPVSEADIAVNDMLHGALRGHRPDYGWLSEETEDDEARLAKDAVWIIDPIDGTRAFIKGKPHFTICVALVRDGAVVSGVVFNPATDEFFEAIAGGGARLNGSPIRVSKQTQIEGCRMAAFSPMFKHPAWPEAWPEMDVIDRNSVAYRLVLVASGQVDAAMALNKKNDWDLAAADLIVHEAGGRLTTHDGHRMVYNKPQTYHKSFLCAGPSLYEALFTRVGVISLP